MARLRLGELLLSKRAVTAQQLEAALAIQKQTRQRLGVILVERGALSEEALAASLSESLGVPRVDLSRTQPDWSAIHLVRARTCETHDLFPFALLPLAGQPRRSLAVAIADPLNTAAIQEVEFSTGLVVALHLAPVSAIRAAVLRYHHKVSVDPRQSKALLGTAGSVRVAAPPPPLPATPPPAAPAAPPIVVGTALEAPERAAPARKPLANAQVAKDLEFLFGAEREEDAVDQLDKKLWALLRVLARKGLITREEFLKELGDDAE
jgi:hypothetical protein